MAVSARYVVHQAPVVGAILRTAVTAASPDHAGAPCEVPGPVLYVTLPPRPRDLVRDYVKHVGGDPGAYKNTLPPHLFPQSVFPLQARALEGIHYPMQKVLNGGCKITSRAPLPIDEALDLTCQLERIDDDGRRAVLHLRAITGTKSSPDALICEMQAVVPLGGGEKKAKKERPRVPEDAMELQRFKLGPKAGLDFALLTGDFNPVHWIPPYAKAFGFRNTILHGFSTLARAYEGIVRTRLAGKASAMREFDVRFTRPLVLPAKVGLYLTPADRGVFVGDAQGGPAYLVGRYEASAIEG
jgi:acyl dehydratase